VSRGLLDQLDVYFSALEARQGPVTAEQVADVANRVRELPPGPVPIRQRPRVGIAAVAAALVIVAIGAVPLLVDSSPSDVAPVTDPPVTAPAEGTEMLQVPAALSPARPSVVQIPFDPAELTWSRVAVPEGLFAEDEYASEIVAVGSRLVLLGREDCDGDRRAAVWTSEDGYVWSRLPHNKAFQLTPSGSPQCPFGFRDVVAGGPGLVAVGDVAAPGPTNTIKAAVWTSSDGLNWSRVSPDGDSESMTEYTRLWSVYQGGPGLVAVGEACELPPSGEQFLCDEGAVEAVVWTSPDGVAWTRVEDLPTEFASTRTDPSQGSFIETVAASDESFVGAVSTESGFAFWTSQDGNLWTKRPLEDTSPQTCFQWMNSRLFATDEPFAAVKTCNDYQESESEHGVGFSQYYSTVWASPDGQRWTATALEPGEIIHDALGTPLGFIAVGRTANNLTNEPGLSDQVPTIWMSLNGTKWTRIDLHTDMADRGVLTDVILGGPGLVALGNSPEGPTLWIATQPSP
jgi:hypothetical protein